MDFNIYPAIDIRGGQCVRLFQGDYALESVYYQNPLEAARKWAEAGARWLHIIDLDGAKTGRPVNLETIKKIIDQTDIQIQVGGGIRSLETAKAYLENGVDRIILGSIALSDPMLTKDIIKEFGPKKVIVSVDGRANKALKEGWLEQTESSLLETILYLSQIGVETFIYTDVEKDGTLKGPSIDEALSLAQESGKRIILAGGIKDNQDVLDLAVLAEKGIEGAVIGRALYTGGVDLKELMLKLKGAD